MRIRRATASDVHDLAKLALIAGEGIPAWFWSRSAAEGQSIEDAGAAKLLSETDNFSYRNAHVAEIDNRIAGMILAYRLPDADNAENLEELPAFIRPLVELELVPSFHILTSGEGLTQKFRGSKINSFMSIVRGNQELMSMFVFDGIFMRHPNLKIVSAEADGGWIPHYMYRMDHAYDRHRHWMRGKELEKRPSDYFREHIYFTFQDDYTAFQFKDYLNIERMMWANDFPHSDSTWPWSQKILKDQLTHMTEEEKNRVLHDNAAELYGLNTSALGVAA